MEDPFSLEVHHTSPTSKPRPAQAACKYALTRSGSIAPVGNSLMCCVLCARMLRREIPKKNCLDFRLDRPLRTENVCREDRGTVGRGTQDSSSTVHKKVLQASRLDGTVYSTVQPVHFLPRTHLSLLTTSYKYSLRFIQPKLASPWKTELCATQKI